MVTGKSTLPLPGELLKEAWQRYRERFRPLFGLALIGTAVSVVSIAFLLPKRESSFSVEEWIGIGLVLIVGTLLSFALSAGLLQVFFAPKKLDTFSALKLMGPRYWRFVGYSILYGLYIIVGLLLLVIPGIIVAVWGTFGTYLVIEGKAHVFDAFRQSRELIVGRFWPVTGRLLVIVALGLVLGAVAEGTDQLLSLENQPNFNLGAGLVVNLFFVPYSTAYLFSLYRALRRQGSGG